MIEIFPARPPISEQIGGGAKRLHFVTGVPVHVHGAVGGRGVLEGGRGGEHFGQLVIGGKI